MEIVKCKKNQALFHQGEVAECMFEIISGEVGIFMDYGENGQKEIGVLGEGDFLGELELIDCSVRIASAIALGNDVVVKKLSIEDLNAIVKEKPAKIILMIQQLCSRVRKLDNLYLEACATIDEYRKVKEANEKPDADLIARLHKFADVARKRGS